MRKPVAQPNEQDHDRRRYDACQINALRQPPVALIMIASSVSLRYERVEAQQQADPEQRWCVADCVSQRDCSNSYRAQPPHHDVVDDTLRHPAKLAEHNRNGERNHRRKLGPPFGARLDHLSNLSGAQQKA